MATRTGSVGIAWHVLVPAGTQRVAEKLAAVMTVDLGIGSLAFLREFDFSGEKGNSLGSNCPFQRMVKNGRYALFCSQLRFTSGNDVAARRDGEAAETFVEDRVFCVLFYVACHVVSFDKGRVDVGVGIRLHHAGTDGEIAVERDLDRARPLIRRCLHPLKSNDTYPRRY